MIERKISTLIPFALPPSFPFPFRHLLGKVGVVAKRRLFATGLEYCILSLNPVRIYAGKNWGLLFCRSTLPVLTEVREVKNEKEVKWRLMTGFLP